MLKKQYIIKIFFCLAALAGGIDVFAQVKLMAIGDSKTQGDEFLGWRDALYNKLSRARYSFTPVGNYGNRINNLGGIPPMKDTCGAEWINDIGDNGRNYTGKWPIDFEGHGGFQAGKTCSETGYTDHALAQMVEVDIPRFTPDIIIMDIGTNDIWGGWTAHGPWYGGKFWSGTKEAAAENVLQLIDKIHSLAPNAYILASEIGRVSAGMEYSLQEFGQLLKKGISERIKKGWRIQYVGNIYADLTPADVSPDHVHPLRSGYLKMANRWYKAMLPVFDKQGKEKKYKK